MSHALTYHVAEILNEVVGDKLDDCRFGDAVDAMTEMVDDLLYGDLIARLTRG